MAQVIFDPAHFVALFPQFATIPAPRLQMMFGIAETSILDNTDNSPVMSVEYRSSLFDLLVAHLLTLLGDGTAAGARNAPPGRLSSATEGTVSTSFEFVLPAGSAMAAWFNQTQFGAMYWMATAQFRSLRYYASGDSGVGVARAYAGTPFNVPGGVIPSP